jgi:hypothetical protein
MARRVARMHPNPAVIAHHRGGARRRPMKGRGGRSSIPETPMIESRGRGALDTPHARDNDGRSGQGIRQKPYREAGIDESGAELASRAVA